MLLAASCVEPLGYDVLKEQAEADQAFEGKPVTITFGVGSNDPATKALTELPDIRSMHVFMFNAEGILVDAERATFDPVTANGESNKKRWTVHLAMGTAERHLHFVANLDTLDQSGTKEYKLPTTGSEVALIRSLISTGGDDAYWQRIVLPENVGVGAYKYDGTGQYQYTSPNDGSIHTVAVENIGGFISKSGTSPNISYVYYDEEAQMDITVNRGDYITTAGAKVISGTGLYASEATAEYVQMIPLIRNFARIRIMSATTSNFQITRAALINVPKAGYIAPYDDAAGSDHNHFVDDYMPDCSVRPPVAPVLSREIIDNSGYPATIPAVGLNTDLPTEFTTASAAGGMQTAILYMYERGIPEENATAILVEGTLDGTAGRWFKIDVVNTDGDYFPIYRDFTYDITINSINGTSGYATAQAAFENAAVGDISSSPDTKTLARIDDGKGLELWVEYIDYTSVSTAASSPRLLYKFTYTDPNTHTVTNLSNTVTLSTNSYQGYGAAIATAEPFSTPAPYGGTDTPDSQTGWYITTVNLNAAGSNLLKTDLHVSGSVESGGGVVSYSKTLSRDITYRVMPKQNLTLHTTGLSSANTLGATTELSITMPNILGYSAFPLVLKIEALDNNLNPVIAANLPVDSGASAFGVSGSGRSFYFLKTISYAEYELLVEAGQPCTFTATFATTQGGTGVNNATWLAVSDVGGYFNTAFVQVKVGNDSDTEPWTPTP